MSNDPLKDPKTFALDSDSRDDFDAAQNRLFDRQEALAQQYEMKKNNPGLNDRNSKVFHEFVNLLKDLIKVHEDLIALYSRTTRVGETVAMGPAVKRCTQTKEKYEAELKSLLEGEVQSTEASVPAYANRYAGQAQQVLGEWRT